MKEDQMMSLGECVRAHRQGKILLGEEIHTLNQGVNTMRMVERGALVYDPSSQSYSCTNEPGRQTSDPSKHLKSELKMTIYEVVLGKTPGRMRTDSNRVVVAGGLHEGTELSSLEVQSGGRERDGITLVLDHPEEIENCPFAILREKIALTQYLVNSDKFGEPVKMYSGREKMDLAGIALVGEQIAIRLETKESLPVSCMEIGGGGENVYKTNHAGILAVHLVEGVRLEALSKNKLLVKEMDIDLTTASRLDLMGYHVSQALSNISESLEKDACVTQLEEMTDLIESDGESKTRVLPAGEVIVLSRCKHLLVKYSFSANASFTDMCPTYLPVSGWTESSPRGQWWLEPRSRYLYRESPKQSCALSKILPIWFELRSGDFVSFDGKGFVKQDVEEYNWMDKKRYYSETGMNVWEDLRAQGMVTKEKMKDLDIYQEYSIYLTKKAAKDQGPGNHEDTPLARASGPAVRSWMREVKQTAGRVFEEGMEASLDGLGLSDFQKILVEVKSFWEGVKHQVHLMGTLGGTMFLIQKVLAMMANLITFWCTKEGNKVDKDYEKDKRYKWLWSCGGCAGKITRACCICSLETCCGNEARKQAVMERVVRDLVEQEMIEARAHLRDEAYINERRRESQGNELEMAELMGMRRT